MEARGAAVARNLLDTASMRIPSLSSLLLAAALTSAPSVAAWAAPPAAVAVAPAQPSEVPAEPAAAAAPVDEAAGYAAREAKDAEAAKFRGGSTVLVIGGSTLTVVLLVVLLVVVL